MSENKLDIFELLRAIDDNKRDFLEKLPEGQRKGFVPVVSLRWLSGSGNESQLLNMNEVVNSTVFNLYKHPDLIYKLMVAATPKGRKNYNWLKTKKKDKLTKRLDVIRRYLEVPAKQAVEFAALYTDADILEMCDALGEPKEFVQQLKAEMK